MRPKDRREVQQRSRHIRHRDAAMDRHFVGLHRGLVDTQARPRAATAGHGDVGSRRRGVAHAPQRTRRAMGEDGAVAGGEDGRHPGGLAGERGMAHREDAPMKRMQATLGQAMVDRAAADAERAQLSARHDAVLACRERGDRGVDRARRTFAVHVSAKVRRDSHRPIVAASACRISTRSHQLSRETPQSQPAGRSPIQ
jgi:hypothetical protein